MDNSWLKEIHFERCPKCGAIVLFKKDSDVSKCEKCGTNIKLKK
jgi:ribosomal protein S27AE